MCLHHRGITLPKAVRGVSAPQDSSVFATPKPFGCSSRTADVQYNCIFRNERLTRDLFNSLGSTMSPAGFCYLCSYITPHHTAESSSEVTMAAFLSRLGLSLTSPLWFVTSTAKWRSQEYFHLASLRFFDCRGMEAKAELALCTTQELRQVPLTIPASPKTLKAPFLMACGAL